MPDVIGSVYMINGIRVPSPDEEVWSNIVVGDNLDALETRSPYQELTWRRTAGERCDLDWHDFDGLELSSITCTPPGEVGVHRTFTRSQKCKSVVHRNRRGTATEITATFLVDTR